MTERWQPSERYPDPAIVALDPSFKKYHLALSAVERLWHGSRWGEGPVWLGDLRCLLWSDIPNDRVLKWDETTGAVSEWRKPSNNANGHTRDRQGRIIACEHAGRRVVRFEHDGSITVLADSYQGKRLNSPNDVVVKSDGSIWFTDPPFGTYAFYEGIKTTAELPHTNVYRIDGQSGAITCVADDVNHPNGLAFSPDESILYVIESRSDPRNILAFDVVGGTKLAKRRVFVECRPNETPDGFRVDVDGNLWCGWGMTPELDGVRVINSSGAYIGHIHLPERCANLAFGGRNRNRLFMSAAQSLYALYVNTQGVAGG
ncbi:gluconolactonase [Siccirubricoccus deserti]|uniref:SMP-30/gluconolactonase/LRE family protein n=1 Tax=Siccirubricoccus deserti TaxID=2013562 RepID=A0A9X0QUM1_9PROT|nr:SMP-30/gluconolactonase/LRE family protein [Siccirubricoccus deserti]MBC4014061.1 SMP-30/gluconolactonase/LRE family protein [Siccirubricoccus deserti]GGC26153.1 gluconolactonase [Siccirubricoccus deserti]